MPTRFRSDLPSIAASLPRQVGPAVKAGAELIRFGASVRAPDRHPLGEGLVAAIHVDRRGPTSYAVVAGDDEVFYGHMVEHGTTHSAPHPFLIPAQEEAWKDVENLVAMALRDL